jgi:hypothetical protein
LSVATALPRLSPRNDQGSGEIEFLLRFFDLKRNPIWDAPGRWVFLHHAAIRQIYREGINAAPKGRASQR